MKRLIYLGVIAAMASCSSSRYAAHFQRSNSESGYGELADHTTPALKNERQTENLIASTAPGSGVIMAAPDAATMAAVKKNYEQLSKSEKREFRKALNTEVKNITKAKATGKTYAPVPPGLQKTHMLDHDLKFAAIFGSVGVTALLISGTVFNIIGAVALIIGVVFFVMWLSRQ